MRDVYDNLDKNEFKNTIDGKTYDLKNAKKILVKIATQKTCENQALKLCNNLITPDIVVLEKSTSRGNNRKENVLNLLKNLESIFTGVYLHYDSVPKLES